MRSRKALRCVLLLREQGIYPEGSKEPKTGNEEWT
jgi:hypothetical protein